MQFCVGTMAFETALPQGKTKVSTMRAFWIRALIFVVIGLLLYVALAAYAERKMLETSERHPFVTITSAPQETDVVVLGASHAMQLGFDGIQPMVEQNSGRKIMVLAIKDGGVVPNAVILNALLKKSKPRTIVYVLDTFAFLSPRWNEERLNDGDLFVRAPFDRDLIDVLREEPSAWGTMLGYASGFEKIKRLSSADADSADAELTKLDQIYQPDDRIDDQRVGYLFSDSSAELMQGYVDRLAAMAQAARQAGSEFILLQMPVPPRYTSRLPEAHYEVLERVQAMAQAAGVCVIDHTEALPGDENYYDTDHLNRLGLERYTAGLLAEALLLPAGEATENPSPWCVSAVADEEEDTTEEEAAFEEEP